MHSIAIVHGSKDQQPGTHQIRRLYTSELFKKKRTYAELCCDDWVVISEQYRVVDPDEEVDSYDRVLDEMDEAEQNQWVTQTKQALSNRLFDEQNNPKYERIVVLASQVYLELFESVFQVFDRNGGTVSMPLKGKKIGEQLQWLKREATRCS